MRRASAVVVSSGNSLTCASGFDLNPSVRGVEAELALERKVARQIVTRTARGCMVQNRVASTLRGKRILLVEDEADAREMIELVLAEAGANVASASSGKGALDHMRQGPFDIVVSDIGLPGMDGYALAHELREVARSYGSEPPMVAFTAFTDATHRQRAVDAGFEAHIAKPVDPVALVSLVSRLLAMS